MSSLRPLLFAAALAACARPAPGADCPPTHAGDPPATEPAPAAAGEPPPDRLVLTRIDHAALPGFAEDPVGEAIPALRRSCERLARLGDDHLLGPDEIATVAGDWRAACDRAATVDPGDHAAARRLFSEEFVAHAAANRDDTTARFTGYYEASLRGSKRRRGPYQSPVYGRPADLMSVNLDHFDVGLRGRRVWGRRVGNEIRPYFTRAEIAAGALAGQGLEILWVDDPVDHFFAQVQGSGRVVLDDGSEVRIGFAGKSGRPYTAIGRVLVAEGELTAEQASMQGIRAWLGDNPERAEEIMNRNEAFVFFALLGDRGPFGSQNVVLTPGRSIAVDRAFVPLSTPVWVDTTQPAPDGDGETALRRLLIAQDTGGGILGPLRGDIYFGGDELAAAVAGRMRQSGRTYLLLPRAAAARLDAR